MTQIQEYGGAISLAQAKPIVERAEAQAQALNCAMVIVVVDVAGYPVVLHKMDNAQYGSVAIAQAKAKTALNFKRPSKVYDDLVSAGGAAMRLLALGEICPIEGGVPLLHKGKIIGALGVSGSSPSDDGEVANAGASALDE